MTSAAEAEPAFAGKIEFMHPTGSRTSSCRRGLGFAMNIANLMDLVEAAKHYPRVKRAWVEYLGEHPDPVIDRVR